MIKSFPNNIQTSPPYNQATLGTMAGANGITPGTINYYTLARARTPSLLIRCLNRITLRAYPTATASTVGTSNYNIYGLGYTQAQAELIFRSQDDLLLNAPEGDNPPTQLFSPLAGNPNRRQFQGDYSWLATVVPSYRSFEVVTNTSGGSNTYTITPQGDTNAVIVSIVVFYKRIPNPLPTQRHNSAVGTNAGCGGDGCRSSSGEHWHVHLPHRDRGRRHSVNLPARGGESQQCRRPAGVPQPASGPVDHAEPDACYHWLDFGQFRAAAADQSADSGQQCGGQPRPSGTAGTRSSVLGRCSSNSTSSPASYYRNVTLSGPDWNPGTQANPIATYASIFDGVVAVYEKEMELEQSGAPGAKLRRGYRLQAPGYR